MKKLMVPLTRYFDEMTLIKKKIQGLLDESQDEAFSSEAQSVLEQVSNIEKDLSSYFASYSKQWKKMKDGEFLMQLIAIKKKFRAAINEFACYTETPQKLLETLEWYSEVLNATKTYKNVVLIRPDFFRSDCAFFEKAGFTVTCQGVVLTGKVGSELVAIGPSPFSPQEVQSILASVFEESIAPVYEEDNPFELFLPRKEYLPYPEQKERGRLCILEQMPDYVDPTSLRKSRLPFQDYSTVKCIECSLVKDAHAAAQVYPNNTCTCSVTCSVKHHISTQPALQALLAEKKLDSEHVRILEQLAGLCYLRYISLSPAAGSFDGQYYHLKQCQLAELLSDLTKQDLPPYVQTVLEFAQACGIDVAHLAVFNTIFMRLKQSYHNDLLARAKGRTFGELLEFDGSTVAIGPEFDEKGRIALLQKRQFEVLCTFFKSTSPTPDLIYPRFYYELMTTVGQRVGFSAESLERVLTVKFPDVSFEDAVALFPEEQKIFVKERRLTKRKTFSIDPCAPNENRPSEEVVIEDQDQLTSPKQESIQTVRIPSMFGEVPYLIHLFNVRPFIPVDRQTGKTVWKTCRGVRDSYRLRTIAALAEVCSRTASIVKSYTSFKWDFKNEEYDESLRSKLDLHHLFPSIIRRYIRKYGVAEKIDNLIQLSIPGRIMYEDGQREHGFFQESFIPGIWVCIHRCFKRFTGQESVYISPALREALEMSTSTSNDV